MDYIQETKPIDKLQVPLEELVKRNKLITARNGRKAKHVQQILFITNYTVEFLRILLDCEPHRSADLERTLSTSHGKAERISKQLVKTKMVEKYKKDTHTVFYRITEKGISLYTLLKDDIKPSE